MKTVSYAKKVQMMKMDTARFIEKRGGLDYLPWVEARLLLDENFPGYVTSTVVHWESNGSAYVVAKLFNELDEQVGSELYFPVMDYKHKAIMNPDTRQISDAIMRAMVKVIAIETGIGLELFRKEKEGLPEESEAPTFSSVSPLSAKKFGQKLV